MYSISLTNYHIKKRPFTTNYLVAKNMFIYFCYPAQLSQMSFLKKIQILHTYRLHLFIHVEEENKICSSSSRQSYNLKRFAEHPVASFVYLPAHKCTSPDFTGAVTQPPPKKEVTPESTHRHTLQAATIFHISIQMKSDGKLQVREKVEPPTGLLGLISL